MRRTSTSRDLLLVAAATLLAAAVELAPVDAGPVRAVVALPVVFLLPGYAISAALLVHTPVAFGERVMYSLGISLATVMLSGLLLAITPWGLQAGPWALMLLGATLVAALVAHSRRAGSSTQPSWIGIPRPDVGQSVLFGLAAFLLAGALLFAAFGQANKPYADFTQLWILPANAPATQPGQDEIQLGFQNMGKVTLTYRLELTDNGILLHEWPDRGESPITLQPGQKWETTIAVPADAFHTGPVQATLYRLDDPTTPYRTVYLRSAQG
jgi:hypothetical protein